MDTPDEIARDEAYAELVDEISREAIDEFTSERLRSYYIGHPNVAVQVFNMHREAKKLVDVSPSAALVLFTTAIEVALKVTLLKPVIYGLVHNELVADLISDLAVKHNGFDRFKPLLGRVLAEYGAIDFEAFTIQGHKKTMWGEITVIQNTRNAVVHRAELANRELTLLAQDVSTMIIGNYLTAVLKGLGLHLSTDGVVGNLSR
jgi:hypothetical protein